MGFWALSFYLGVVTTEALHWPAITALPSGILCAFSLQLLGSMAFRLMAAPAIARLSPPVDVPPPPPDDGPATVSYVRPPRPTYPTVAQAKGQCGWVKLGLKSDQAGRIVRFRVIDQAPGRLFERCLARALIWARLPADASVPGEQERLSLIVFVLPGKHAPDWAIQRLDRMSQAGRNE